MPSITKQSASASGNSKPVPSIVGSIAPVSKSSSGVKLNVYGMGKTGKTRFACSFPKPLLLIGTEDGTKSVSNVSGVDFVKIHSSGDLTALTEHLASNDNYASVVLDTAGGFQDIILKEVLCLDEIPVAKFRQAGKGEAWGIADKGTWGTIGNQWKERMRRFLSLAEVQGLDVVVIAHEREFGEEGKRPSGIPYTGAALTPSVANWLNAECDYVVQAFIRQKEISETMTVGVGKSAISTTVRKKVKGVEYCLRLVPDDTYMAGFRVPSGIVLPDIIVDPSYDKIVAIIEGRPIK